MAIGVWLGCSECEDDTLWLAKMALSIIILIGCAIAANRLSEETQG